MSEWVLTSSILILLIIFIRGLFRNKISLRLRYALWLVVALRLLLPLSFSESSFSILNFLEWRDAGAQGQTWDGAVSLQKESGSDKVLPPERERETYHQETIPEGDNILRTSYEGPDAENTEPGLPDKAETKIQTEESVKGQLVSAAEMERGTGKQGGWKTVFLGVWLAGAVIAAGTVLTVNGNHRSRVRRSRIKYRTNGESVLPVYLSSAVDTPCIFGLLHPAVYLTPELEKDEKKLKYVLCHENTHYRHLDHVWVVVRAVCVCIHWYNPLVWMAAELSRQDCELACDEKALKLLDREERIDYGRTLLDLSVQNDVLPGGLQLSTAVSGGKRQLKERLLMIVGYPRRPVSAVILTTVLVLLVSAATFTDRVQGQDSAEMNPEVEGTNETEHGKSGESFDVASGNGAAMQSVQNTSIVTVDLKDGEDYILKVGGQIEGEDGIYRIEGMELKRIYGRREETLQTIRLEDVKVLYTRSLDEIRADGGDMWAFCTATEALFAKALCTVEDLPAYAAEKFPTKESGKSVAELLTGGILVADLNFDGYQDFGLQGRSGTENVPFYCFLWDPEEGKFEPAYMIPNLQVDEQAEMLVSKTSDGDGVQSVKYYSFDENRTLHMVRYVETNPSPDAVFPVLDLTYCEVPYGLPAVDEWDYGTRYGGALTQRFVYWAKQALTELYEWSGTKLDQVCFTMTDFGDLYFGNSPQDVRASRTFYNRCYGEQAGFEFCIPSMSLATECVVWYSPVIQWRVPENLAQMTDEEVALWYFDRSGLAEGETMETIELSDEGSYIIKTRAGNYYTISLQSSTREVHDIYGPYEGYPNH